MEKVPQIVRDRLKAGPPPDVHPDADLLTAFAEKALSERERTGVLEHLARCRDCRDVVALALPLTDTMEIAKVPQHHGWITWPAMRWGFVTAGVVIIGLGIFEYQRHPDARMSGIVAKQIAQPEPLALEAHRPQSEVTPAAAKPVASPSALSPGKVQDDKRKVLDLEKQEHPSHSDIPQLHGLGSPVGGPTSGPRMPAQWQAQQQSSARVEAFLPAPSPKPVEADSPRGRAASMQVETQGEAVSIAPSAGSSIDQAAPAYASSAPVARPFDNLASVSVNKTKPATNLRVPATAGAGGALVSLRWSINSTGGLQRSTDGGNTWHDVDVAGSSVNEELAYAVTSEVVSARAESKPKTPEKKSARKDVAVPVFRAVAAIGSEVWAGGSNAALYHSLDAGNHWTRVMPFSGSSILGGDIVSVQFTDSQHVSITTAVPEIWATSDGGQTWQKQ